MRRLDPESLKNESEIIWLMDISQIEYVREAFLLTRGNTKFPQSKAYWKPHTLVGYAVLSNTATDNRTRMQRRRYFYLKPHARYFQPNGSYAYYCPAEAVDPLTVSPGIPGKATSRSIKAPQVHNQGDSSKKESAI